ncbi:hypothetical protein CFC21_040385, partial [Triticum aestivum]
LQRAAARGRAPRRRQVRRQGARQERPRGGRGRPGAERRRGEGHCRADGRRARGDVEEVQSQGGRREGESGHGGRRVVVLRPDGHDPLRLGAVEKWSHERDASSMTLPFAAAELRSNDGEKIQAGAALSLQSS